MMKRSGHRHEAAGVRDALLEVGLGAGQLVRARLHEPVGLDEPHRVGAPVGAERRRAGVDEPVAELVLEDDAGRVVVEDARVPERDRGVADALQHHGGERVGDREQQSVATARRHGEALRRVGGDVVASGGRTRLGAARHAVLGPERGLVVEQVELADDRRVLGRRERHLDDLQRVATGAVERRPAAVGVHVHEHAVGARRVGDHGVRVPAAARAHGRGVPRGARVADVEDAQALPVLRRSRAPAPPRRSRRTSSRRSR